MSDTRLNYWIWKSLHHWTQMYHQQTENTRFHHSHSFHIMSRKFCKYVFIKSYVTLLITALQLWFPWSIMRCHDENMAYEGVWDMYATASNQTLPPDFTWTQVTSLLKKLFSSRSAATYIQLHILMTIWHLFNFHYIYWWSSELAPLFPSSN